MRIAFTSCSAIVQQKDYQPIWGIINGQQPDLLLLLGDNVYIGTDGEFDAAILEDKYQRQLAEPHFNKLLCEVPYLAIWDNHDMGVKSKDYTGLSSEHLQQSRDLFYRYLKCRSVVPYSVIPGTNEIYCTYTHGNVKFIMLDVRSYQQDPTDNDDATLLGSDQETWLLNELGNTTGITVICSGMCYSYKNAGWKKYKNTNWFNNFNKRVAETSKPLFLGGDIHKNFFKHHIVRREPIIGYPEDSSNGIINPPQVGSEPIIGNPANAPAGIINSPLTIWDTNFYEIISSSVGRNVGGLIANPPLNKYGIIDITNDEVEITLYSQQAHNFIHKVIDRESWELVE